MRVRPCRIRTTASSTNRWCGSSMVCGWVRLGRVAYPSIRRVSLSTRALIRMRIWPIAPAISCHCSCTSGTTRLAASVGVEARRSAARSISVQSSSCPTAETIGVTQAAVARTTPSSEKPMRSSKLPPPRATMITSTSGSASSRWIAAMTSAGHCAPCTCAWTTLNRTAGQRRLTFVITSPSARACGAHTSPMHAGNSGSGTLFSASNSPSPLSRLRSSSIWALRSPAPMRRMSSATKLRRVALTHTSALPCTTTRSP